MKIKVIFDFEVIGKDYKINQTGIFRVAYELLKQLMLRNEIEVMASVFNFNNDKEITAKIGRFTEDHQMNFEQVNRISRVKFLPFRKEKLFRLLYRKLGISNYKISFTKAIAEAQIYHSLYFPLHPSIQKYNHLRKIITVHDLIPILFPEYNDNTKLLKDAIKSIGKQNYAVCVSENTRRDLLKYAPELDPEKVFVALLAASPEIFYVCRDGEKFKEIQNKYALPNRYVLSLSTLEPRKNIQHVIKCFVKTITENNIDDLSLVLVGSKGWDYGKIFEEYEKHPHLKDKIIITGRISDEDLAAVYSNAEAFLYMSLYEGFGLPPLEAMQCGTPTVVSNVSSLPEVVGNAGFLVDPQDDKALVAQMLELYNNPALREEYSKRGLEQARKFSWEITADQHLEIYKKILSSPSEVLS